MRVIHIAGFTLPAEFLCSEHRKFGINADLSQNEESTLLGRPLDLRDLWVLTDEDADIFHFHGVSSLAFINNSGVDEIQTLLREIKERGTKLVFSAYGQTQSEHIKGLLKILSEDFNHTIISCPASLLLTAKLDNWSWVNPGLPTHLFECTPKREVIDRPLRVIRLNGKTWSSDSPEIDKSLRSLHESERIQLMHFDVKESFKIEDLIALFQSADVFVDCLGKPYSYFSMFAMATGMLPIGYNPEELSQDIPSLKLSPVMHAEPGTIVEKLNALIDQPRSVSDFSSRCCNYASLNLRLEFAASETKKVYEALLGKES